MRLRETPSVRRKLRLAANPQIPGGAGVNRPCTNSVGGRRNSPEKSSDTPRLGRRAPRLAAQVNVASWPFRALRGYDLARNRLNLGLNLLDRAGGVDDVHRGP